MAAAQVVAPDVAGLTSTVQFHLEPTDLCIQPGVVLLLGLLLFGDGGTENLG